MYEIHLIFLLFGVLNVYFDFSPSVFEIGIEVYS